VGCPHLYVWTQDEALPDPLDLQLLHLVALGEFGLVLGFPALEHPGGEGSLVGGVGVGVGGVAGGEGLEGGVAGLDFVGVEELPADQHPLGEFLEGLGTVTGRLDGTLEVENAHVE